MGQIPNTPAPEQERKPIEQEADLSPGAQTIPANEDASQVPDAGAPPPAHYFLIETPTPGPKKEPVEAPVATDLASPTYIPRGEDSDSAENEYAEHLDEMSGNSAIEALRADFAGDGTAQPAPAAPAAKDEKGAVKSVGIDVMTGLGESPSQIVGGARDALQATIDGLGEFGQWVTSKMPDMLQGGLVTDAEGMRILGKEEYAKWRKDNNITKTTLQLPEIHGPKSVTGGIIRGMSQFITGFSAMGRIGKMAGVGKAATTAGKVAQGAAKGFATDFTAFQAHEKNLANLLKDHTSLKGPILDYLASDPSDGEAEGRFKNALTGLVTGVAADTVITGMTKALKLMRDGRAAEAVGNFVKKMNGEEAVREVQPHELHPLGDPEKPLISQAKLEQGDLMADGVTPKDVRGKVGDAPGIEINFAAINNADDIKSVVKKLSQRWKKQLEGAKRGERSHAETKLSADQQNAWEIVMSRRQGQALNAEELVAVRELWVTSANKLKEMATLAHKAPSEANLYNFRKMVGIYYAVKKEAVGAAAEAGRALEAMKIKVGDSKGLREQLDGILEGAGGVADAKYMAEKISGLANSGKAAALDAFVEGSVFSKGRDAIAQAYTNALLSSPTSHVKNIVSNLTFAAMQIYERRAAEYLGQILGSQGGVEAGEAAAMAGAMKDAFRDAFVLMGQKMKDMSSIEGLQKAGKDAVGFLKSTGDVADIQTKYEVSVGKLSAERWNVQQGTWAAKALDTIDVATRYNGRLMGAMDDVFKTLARRMETQAQATRIATREMNLGQLSKENFAQRVNEIVSNPPPSMQKAVDAQAAYQTFTQKPNEFLNKVGSTVRQVPVLGRLLLPFKNTPINVSMAAVERSPLAPLVSQFRADIAAGGARRDMALARMATGTAIMAVTTDLALSGKITGKGPTDPGARAQWQRSRQPYSFLVGDTWVSYNANDPAGINLALAADYAEAVLNAGEEVDMAEFEKAMTAMVFSLSNNVLSKSYMSSMADFMSAVVNSDMKAYSFGKKVAGTLPGAVGVPVSLMANVARQVDPYARVAETYVDAVRAKVPFLSKGLPPQRNLWGEPRSYASGLGPAYDFISPVWLKSNKQHPIDKELDALKYFPSMPDSRVHFGDVAIKLNAKQYSRFIELAGNGYKDPATGQGCLDYLNDLVSGSSPFSQIYDNMKIRDAENGTDNARQYIRNTIDQFREKAKKALMAEDLDLQAIYDVENKSPAKIPAGELFQR